MVTGNDVSHTKLIPEIATGLKAVKEIAPPSWAPYVKTGSGKERTPSQDDWWHTRAAAILVSIYKGKTIGVSKLRTKYGNKKNRGYQPEKFTRASGNIIRKCLQQLDKAGLTKVELKEQRKGRKITAKGKSFVDKAATKALKQYPNAMLKHKSKSTAKTEKAENTKTEKAETAKTEKAEAAKSE